MTVPTALRQTYAPTKRVPVTDHRKFEYKVLPEVQDAYLRYLATGDVETDEAWGAYYDAQGEYDYPWMGCEFDDDSWPARLGCGCYEDEDHIACEIESYLSSLDVARGTTDDWQTQLPSYDDERAQRMKRRELGGRRRTDRLRRNKHDKRIYALWFGVNSDVKRDTSHHAYTRPLRGVPRSMPFGSWQHRERRNDAQVGS